MGPVLVATREKSLLISLATNERNANFWSGIQCPLGKIRDTLISVLMTAKISEIKGMEAIQLKTEINQVIA